MWAPSLALGVHVARRQHEGEWGDAQGSDFRDLGQTLLIAKAIRYSPHQCYSSGKPFKPQDQIGQLHPLIFWLEVFGVEATPLRWFS